MQASVREKGRRLHCLLLLLLKRESPNTRIYSQYPRGRLATEETCNMQGESYLRSINSYFLFYFRRSKGDGPIPKFK